MKVYVAGLRSRDRDRDRLSLVSHVLEAANVDATIVQADEFSSPLFTEDAIKMIKSADVVICDVSDDNAIYELGAAQALGKPTLIMAQRSQVEIPFDIAGQRVFFYSTDMGYAEIDNVTSAVAEALRHPESLVLGSKAQAGKPNIFVSYSHSDSTYMDRLLVHLRPLERAGLIDPWVDTRLVAGDLWQTQIEAALDRARVALLLVSADFLASEFIVSRELPRLLEQSGPAGLRVMPIIVRHCRFTRDSSLNKFQAINNPSKPLSALTNDEREEVYDTVTRIIEEWLQVEF